MWECSQTQPKTGMVAHVYNPSIWRLETREIQVQGHPQLQIALEASLDYSRPCFKTTAATTEKHTELARCVGTWL